MLRNIIHLINFFWLYIKCRPLTSEGKVDTIQKKWVSVQSVMTEHHNLLWVKKARNSNIIYVLSLYILLYIKPSTLLP